MFQHVFIFASGKSKEAEIKRINKELANIRNKFKGKFVCINASWSAYYPILFHQWPNPLTYVFKNLRFVSLLLICRL